MRSCGFFGVPRSSMTTIASGYCRVSLRSSCGLMSAEPLKRTSPWSKSKRWPWMLMRPRGMRSPHEIVGALVRRLVAEQRDFESMTLDEWRAASEHFGADVVARVTPEASVAAKRTPQSTAPEAVRAALAEIDAWLASLLPGKK